jgi:hypothetical protein
MTKTIRSLFLAAVSVASGASILPAAAAIQCTGITEVSSGQTERAARFKVFKKPINTAGSVTHTFALNLSGTPAPLNSVVTVSVWATADYQAPNPTWFETTIGMGPNSANNPILARTDTYRDGNATTLPSFNNHVSHTTVIQTPYPELFITVQSRALGPGASTVKNVAMCITYSVQGIWGSKVQFTPG